MKYNNMMNVCCNSPYHHGDCHHSNISYPCQLPKDYRAGGFMLDRNAFMLINSMPFIYAGHNIKYGTKIDVGENIFTRVTQRKDASCVNLNAVFNMCSSNNKNEVLNHFLERIIANKFDDLNNVLPIIKPNIKFTLYFTIRDDNNMIVYEGSSKVYSTEIYYHSTNIVDYFVMSTRNLIITNIPQLEYQGLYKLTLERVDAHVTSINTFEHIEDNLNPYYQFTNNNTTITLQNELIEQTECDDTLLIASSDINHTIHFQANLTTRLRVSFKAFLSDLITTNNTFNIWESLYSPTDAVIRNIQEDIDQVKSDYVDLNTRVSILEISPKDITIYTQGTSYVNGQIVWRVQGVLFQATKDFTSDDTDGNTPEQSMIIDISNGNIVPVQTEPLQLP